MPKKVVIVGIGGASSSGKTTLAKLLHKVAEGSILLHQDDFYKHDSEIPIDKDSGYQNWDCPDAINFDSFIEELEYLRQHGSLSPDESKRYESDTKDQKTLDFQDIDQLKQQITTSIEEKDIQLVFVDGFMLFHDLKIVKLFDLKLFLTASYDTLKHRRYQRSGYQTQESFWVDPPDFFDKIVYPSYAQSHSYLFDDKNVEGSINSTLSDTLQIHTFKNDKDTQLRQVFDWGFDILVNSI